MTKLSIGVEIVCNNCGDDVKIEEINRRTDMSVGKAMIELRCKNCFNIVYLIIDLSSMRFTLKSRVEPNLK